MKGHRQELDVDRAEVERKTLRPPLAAAKSLGAQSKAGGEFRCGGIMAKAAWMSRALVAEDIGGVSVAGHLVQAT